MLKERSQVFIDKKPFYLNKVELIYNNRFIKLLGKSRELEFLFILPIPESIFNLSGKTISYNSKSAYLHKDEYLFCVDLDKSFIKCEDKYYKINGIVLTFDEIDNKKVELTLSVFLDKDDYPLCMMYIYPVLRQGDEDIFVEFNQITDLEITRDENKFLKPIEELTIEDFDVHPIWELALEYEYEYEYYVRPASTRELTEEQKGAFVRGTVQSGQNQYSAILTVDLEGEKIIVDPHIVVFYQGEYVDFNELAKKLEYPVVISLELRVKGRDRKLSGSFTRKDLYKPIILPVD